MNRSLTSLLDGQQYLTMLWVRYGRFLQAHQRRPDARSTKYVVLTDHDPHIVPTPLCQLEGCDLFPYFLDGLNRRYLPDWHLVCLLSRYKVAGDDRYKTRTTDRRLIHNLDSDAGARGHEMSINPNESTSAFLLPFPFIHSIHTSCRSYPLLWHP